MKKVLFVGESWHVHVGEAKAQSLHQIGDPERTKCFLGQPLCNAAEDQFLG